MSGQATYDRAIAKIHAESRDPETIRLMELAALVELKLGRPLEESTFRALAAAQADLRREQDRLEAALTSGGLDPEGYLDRLNRGLSSWMERSREILGKEQFEVMFGEPGRNPDGLIDRKTFLEQQRATSGH